MKKLTLNRDMGTLITSQGYRLDPTEKYYICLDDEIEHQAGILDTVRMMGLPAIDDYHNWLKDNGFDPEFPNPTNAFVSPYFGVQSLWSTELSQGIVVKNKEDDEEDDDYYILMECSRQNEGFKYTQIVLTMGGCM